MKHTITDQGILSKCKAILDKWAASQAYSPTKALGSDAELVSAESYMLERFSIRTSFRVRYAAWVREPGGEYSRSPKPSSAYNIWDDVLASVTTEEFDHGIDETRKRIECTNPACKDGKVECDCDSDGKRECKECHNTRIRRGLVGIMDSLSRLRPRNWSRPCRNGL